MAIDGKSFGRYQIGEELGRGGMGVVYKARDASLNREVALKMLLTMGKKEDMERFLREAQAMASLRHPNLVMIYDIGEYEKKPFFTMEFVPGCSLKDLAKKKSLNVRAIVKIMMQIGRAVAHAHQHGIIHRDLKPSNVMMENGKEPKVMDFGLAKTSQASRKLSKTGMIMGTLQYMPPEQVEGRLRAIDQQSDVYGLGAMLYELITGNPPFAGGSTFNIIHKVLTEIPKPPSEINPRIPKDLEAICMKALEKKKKKRYPTAAAFVEDLAHFSKGKPISARPLTTTRKWMYKIKRNRKSILTCFIILLLCFSFYFFGKKTRG